MNLLTFAVSKEIPDEVHGTVNDLSHFGERKDVECWVLRWHRQRQTL